MMNFSQYYNEETKELILPINFNQKINKSNLPKNIKGIIFLGKDFSVINFTKDTTELRYGGIMSGLHIPRKFNNFFNNHLLTKKEKKQLFSEKPILNIGFDKEVDHLPDGLTHIIFGDKFNQSILYLPNSIIHLTFGANFNKCVEKLPNNLTHLTMGNCFNRPFVNFPINLTHLTLNKNFYHPLNNLPFNLEELEFYIPNLSIREKSSILNDFSNLPVNLKKLKIMNWSTEAKDIIKKIPLDCIVIDINENEI